MSELKTKQSMKEAIASYYSSASLSEEQIARLQSMQHEANTPQEKLKAMELQLASRAVGTTPEDKILSLQQGLDSQQVPSISTSFRYDQMQVPSTNTTRPSSRRLWVSVAVVVALSVVGWFGLYKRWGGTSIPAQELLSAVITHHLGTKGVSIATENMETLRQKLQQLPFSPTPSVHLPKNQWQLVGGSTTAIAQHALVLLRYQHRQTRQQVSLYQTTPWNQHIPASGWAGTLRNVNCKLWYENGLLQILLTAP